MRSSAPAGIVRGHFHNQLPQVSRDTSTSERSRFPFPKQSESAAMPTDQSIRLDDCQSILPVEETGQSGKRKPNGVGGSLTFCFSFDIKAELLSQKQILGGESGWRADAET